MRPVAFLLILSFGMASCGEDDITVDADLGFIYAEPPMGEPGSLAAKIRHFYDAYNTYVFHDFTDKEIRYTYTTILPNYYLPVGEGFEEYAITMLDFIEETLLETFEEHFLKNSLPTRIFLVDEIRSGSEETSTKTEMVMRGNDYIVGYIGASQSSLSWTTFKTKLFQSFLTNLYSNSTLQPTAFFALRTADPGKTVINYTGGWIVDPLRQFPNDKWADGNYDYDTYYTHFLAGFIKPVFILWGWSSGASPALAKDFADFVSFLLTEPAEYINRIMQREELSLLRERILLMYNYLENVFGIDVISTQNGNQPDDKLPAGYFDQF